MQHMLFSLVSNIIFTSEFICWKAMCNFGLKSTALFAGLDLLQIGDFMSEK